ncbi:MAG: Glu-tRNA(Gln) amidotransferase subunit GatE [Candidatus Jordarchaeaceae archaeon]
MSQEAIDIGIEIALLFNAKIIDELHVLRKNYLDGSVPCGFQRTLIIGTEGYIPINGRKVGVATICIEEDAARKIREEQSTVYYRVDRLGIPLVEVVTAPEIKNPEELLKVAYRIGMLLRATGKVKRGLGTIRQDLNVSIEGGERVEIKGVQKLDWIPKLAENEVLRQLALIDIKNQLLNRGVKETDFSKDFKDVSQIFASTKCKIIKNRKANEIVLAVKLPKFAGLLSREIQPGKSFGKEIAEKVMIITGLKGIIHSDENLGKYNISTEEDSQIRNLLALGEMDAYAIVIGDVDTAEKALENVVDRAKGALRGVMRETRRALENGNSEFLRELHGGARLYPDTDTPPLVIERERIAAISKRLPEYPWVAQKRLAEKYKIKEEFVEELMASGKMELFMDIVEKYKIDPTIVVVTLLQTMKSLEREGFQTDNISEENIKDVFKFLSEGKIAKEAVENILQELAKSPSISVSDALKELGLETITVEKLEKIIDEVLYESREFIEKSGDRAFSPMMGKVMEKVRGKIDGKVVAEVLRKKIAKILEEKQ